MKPSLIATGLMALALNSANAADIGSGTLSLSEPMLEFAGGPGVGANVTSTAAGHTCLDPLLPCDDYALTVDLPADIGDFFPDSVITIDLSFESPSGQDDYDLYLYDADGSIMAESTKEGGPERISTIALGGSRGYVVQVGYWLVLGAAYEGSISLDLGAPADEKTEEEISQWLSDNMAQMARAEENPYCVEPGPVQVTDAQGDSAYPVPGVDISSLSVFQTRDEAGEDLIGFQLLVDDLSQLYPQSVYFISFDTIFGVPMGVRMVVDQNNAVSFVSYAVGPDSDDEYEGHFIADGTAKPAHAMSNYSADGVITIYAAPGDIGLELPGDSLLGFNAAVTINVGAEAVATLALNGDSMPDDLVRQGSFTYLSAEECAGMDVQDEESAEAAGRSSTASVRGGGALGGLMIALLCGLLARRRS